MKDEGGDNLFVYGTLRDDGVVRQATGRTFPKVEGTLTGYRRVEASPRFPYPYLVAQEGASVRGTVLLGVDPESLGRLDAYEGGCYERRRVTISTGQGTPEAWVYVGITEEIERMKRNLLR
ncbi:MAG: hypothetical protein A3F84_03285 [Candidatus Handelsmanbacteria bacterium RIFCSPLOWO2_12_FULL_64_10]|uniref:Putative gamma-glutamylcyclotransferase n=1 Tax=Handelsmanbacteria sp. (strain RIFCSPLOWO2_12_FULL_64_10) TaxID=1817868 RepID=A0A1F6CB53_HANXR|nr:MAG: hypothetical protein A3F84_03285 [Candidatus Handelsmanbacteria bacterium RIFCSPLOWO2_12_FULL_64_10]